MELNILQLTQNDYDDYVKAEFTPSRPKPFDKWVSSIYFLLLIIWLAIELYNVFMHQKEFNKVFLCLGVGIPVCGEILSFLIMRSTNKKIILNLKARYIPRIVSITEDGISVKNEYGQSKLTWDLFPKWKEMPSTFLIYHPDLYYEVYPKKCFDSLDDINSFRKMLFEKIGSAQT